MEYLYKDYTVKSNWKQNIATSNNSCLWQIAAYAITKRTEAKQ